MEAQQNQRNLRRERNVAEARSALHEFFGHLPEDCEMRKLASLVFKRTAEFFVDEECSTFEHSDFASVLRDTRYFLEGLRNTLNPLNATSLYPNGGNTVYKRSFYEARVSSSKKDRSPEEWLSFLDWQDSELYFGALFQKGRESDFYWPMDDISGWHARQYLKQPWLHCGEIDQLLVSTMIYQRIIDCGEWLTYASLNHFTPAYRRKQRIEFTLTILEFLLAVSVGIGAAVAIGWWAGFIAAPSFWLLIEFCVDSFNKESRKEKTDALVRLYDLQGAFALAQKTGTSISLLRERLATIDGGKGQVVKAEIFSIIDYALARGIVSWGSKERSGRI
jgi:hypothetical protein